MSNVEQRIRIEQGKVNREWQATLNFGVRKCIFWRRWHLNWDLNLGQGHPWQRGRVGPGRGKSKCKVYTDGDELSMLCRALLEKKEPREWGWGEKEGRGHVEFWYAGKILY